MQVQDVQEIRSRANELLLREEWNEAIELYTQYINYCQQEISNKTRDACDDDTCKLKKSLCLALSNRAEARIRLGDHGNAMCDVNKALQVEPSHPKSLYCKGRILLELDQYSEASDCFQRALDHQLNTADFQEALDRSRRFETQSKTGAYDISEWVSNGFSGKPPDFAEYLGPVEIRSSNVAYGERGLFVTKDVEAGTLLLVTKPVAIARAILPEMFAENARMVIWKEFVAEIERVVKRSSKVLRRVYALSEGDENGYNLGSSDNGNKQLEIPDINLFKPNTGYECESSYAGNVYKRETGYDLEPPCDRGGSADKLNTGGYELHRKCVENPNIGYECDSPEDPGGNVDMNRILRILDLNTLTEKGCTAKKLAPGLYYSNENDCIGLWILPAFVNHSCSPNSSRLHIGDTLFLHASRDLKAGDELTFAYFDVLVPLGIRRELCKTWSFVCRCHRCELEQSLEENLKPIEKDFVKIFRKGGEMEMTKLARKLEEKLMQLQGRVKAKDRQLIRASYALAYWPVFRSLVLLKRWGRQMPSIECIIDAVTSALPGDETALCAAATVVDKLKVNRGLSPFQEAMDRALRICKGLYGKQMKSHVMKALIDAHVKNRGIIVPKS
eukprot:Gb_10639 [translate_table: standard]